MGSEKMSLICVHCGKIIVMSDNPDHLAGCSSCNISDFTQNELDRITESNRNYGK